MASIEKRSATTYRITVNCGYDSSWRKLRKYKTITLPPKLSERQKQKELQREAILFEQQVQRGTYLEGEKVTFSEFSDKWLVDYVEKQLAPATFKQYRTRLEQRILPALGHYKLAKLQPHHLIEFYSSLADDTRLDGFYKPTEKAVAALQPIPNRKLHEDTGISTKTLIRLKKGEQITRKVADKISGYL
ncbi:MAG: site-specific recombinase XerD [Paenibacillus sp.]|jgi:hypothetical protein|nr:site-specific recombinase XerD [Paenibacillus sp.]